jgi:GNAT superfamily N-acetyltransferase
MSNQILGFISGGRKRKGKPEYDCELYAIYLLKDKQGQGKGRKLFLNLLNWLQKAQFKSMLVWVLQENHSARKFYEKLGGVEIDAGVIEIGAALNEVCYGWPSINKINIK